MLLAYEFKMCLILLAITSNYGESLSDLFIFIVNWKEPKSFFI